MKSFSISNSHPYKWSTSIQAEKTRRYDMVVTSLNTSKVIVPIFRRRNSEMVTPKATRRKVLWKHGWSWIVMKNTKVPKSKKNYVVDVLDDWVKILNLVSRLWMLQKQNWRKVYVQSLTLKQERTIQFGGNQKGNIIGSRIVGKSFFPYINNFILIQGLKQNLLRISKLSYYRYHIFFK